MKTPERRRLRRSDAPDPPPPDAPDAPKMQPHPCLFLDFFVKHSPNYLSLHYETLLLGDDL